MQKHAGRTHLFIPDSQVKSGVPIDYLSWVGQYIVDYKPDVVIHAGDFADMPSLSSYETAGSKYFEGRRYKDDVAAANDGWRVLNKPLEDYNAQRRSYKERQWYPERHITLGNHEDRITRAINSDPVKLDGVISIDDLDYARSGWQVHPFLDMVNIDGVTYSHYFYTPRTGRAYGGTAQHTLCKVGFSFTQGHRQGKDIAERELVNGEVHRGLIAGSCYLHDEDYCGPQGNSYWRGVLVKHEVEGGRYDLMEVSLNYLCVRYEGVPLRQYMESHHA